MATNTDEFLSIEDAAKLISVDYKTIYRLVRSGEIPAARIGRKLYRIKRADLDLFFERSKSVQMGVVCSSCGETILSVLGIAATCAFKECDAPLCVKCIKLGETTRCREHAADEARSG